MVLETSYSYGSFAQTAGTMYATVSRPYLAESSSKLDNISLNDTQFRNKLLSVVRYLGQYLGIS